MFDLKYHIASLVAVFLALGIGILIGSTMLSNETLVEYQKQVTNNLENRLETLRQKNESIRGQVNDLEMKLNTQKEFGSRVLPVLVDDRLQDKNIAVIETNEYNSSGKFVDVLDKAGAEVDIITNFVSVPDNKEIDEELAVKTGWSKEDGEDFLSYLSSMVANAVLNGNMQDLEPLINEEILQVTGEYKQKPDGIILVGGSTSKDTARINKIDASLVKVFQNNEIPVYGVEESSTAYSYMESYQQFGITATVDNIDTIPGQLALVLAMDGNPGHYGIKSSARQLVPELNSLQDVSADEE